MHPWYKVEFCERKSRHADMRKWILENPEKRISHGTVRDDGKVFCGYGVGYKNGEHWSDKKTFENRLRLCRENMRKIRKDDPSYARKHAKYCRERYFKRPDVRDKNAKRKKSWGEKYPERINSRASKRRALKRNQLHELHDAEIELSMHVEAKALTAKTGIEHHVDHIIPIKFGGFHHHENLQVLPAGVNFSKSSNPFWTSTEYKDFRSVPKDLWPESLVDFYLAIQST